MLESRYRFVGNWTAEPSEFYVFTGPTRLYRDY